MKNLILCLIAGLTLALSGCTSTLQKLPPISADSFVYERHDPIGGATITAKNVKAGGDGSVSADEVEWIENYPQFGVHVHAVGYKQSATAAPKPSVP